MRSMLFIKRQISASISRGRSGCSLRILVNATKSSPYSSFDVVQTPSKISWRRSAPAVKPWLLNLSRSASITPGNSSGLAKFRLFLNGHIAILVRAQRSSPTEKSSPEEKQAQRSFSSIRPGRVRQGQHRRVAMARYLPLATGLELATVRSVCRRCLYRPESSLCRSL